MAERIVELFETIEVDQDKCRRETMIQAVADNLAIARLENGAIGESSERIGFGLPPQVLHCLAVGGDVLFGAENPHWLSGFSVHVDRETHPAFFTTACSDLSIE